MSIVPLPQFEADMAAAERDQVAYEKLRPPSSMVVRFGAMGLIGEYPYDGEAKPGCGSKMVVRTHRGLEVAEMLTSTCPNAGCSKSVTRKEMLEYIERSGGEEYPFSTGGKILRVATIQDLNDQRQLDGQKRGMLRIAQQKADELGLEMHFVEAEPILGGDRLTFYFTAEHRVDFRELVGWLAKEYATRIELRQVGARDEARLVADYERCGQHCCCKQFLKVLKPVSMRSAKQQKATLDPLKISGRCGRLMCCLRYEDETYADLHKRLPKLKRRIGTPHGIGIVVDRQILTQLVLVRLEESGRQVAVTVEETCKAEEYEETFARTRRAEDPLRGMSPERASRRSGRDTQARHRDRDRAEDAQRRDAPATEGEPQKKRRRRRRRRKPADDATGAPADRPARPSPGKSSRSTGAPPAGDAAGAGERKAEGDAPKKKRRRRRRRRGGGGSGGSSDGGGSGGDSGGDSGGPSGGPSGGGAAR